MVGFFGWGGGVSVGFGFSNIGWVPLGPREVFRPWYGRGYHGGVIVAHNVNITSFRNAGYARGVTSVDFQRGNFRNSAVVDRNTLAQASFVHGTVPATPTAQNLRFSNRVAAVGGANVASQRFYGNSPVAARRTPFAQQQANVRGRVGGAVGGAAPPAQNPNWSRFQSRPGGVAPAPVSPQNQQRPSDRFGGAAQAPNTPRRVEVAPQVLRQRPEAAQAPRNYEPRQQQTPAPSQAPARNGGGFGGGGGAQRGPAPRSAPAGGHDSHGRR
jgi:hypothetical protein